jgi:dTDP-4-dehydrorhamnose reductase
MSRPKPEILLEHIDRKNYRAEQVLHADAIWAVLYQGKPFNLKSLNALTNHPGPKYKKTSFSNPGHAHNLAKKLNELFNTDQFQVYQLTGGKLVTEE